MSEEEQKEPTPNQPYSGPPLFPRRIPRRKRPLLPSPSLQRAITDSDPSPNGPPQFGFTDEPFDQQHSLFHPSPDNPPTLLPRNPFQDLPRPLLIAAWVISVALAMLVVFIVMNAGGHGEAHSQSSRPSPNPTASSIAQGVTAVTTATMTSGNGNRPATSTPGGKAPAPTSLPVAAPTPTPARVPTATIDPSTCSWNDFSGHVAVQSQTIGANTVTVRAQLQWDLTSAGIWCGDLGTDVLITSSNQTVTGTVTSTLTYKMTNGSYTTVTGTKTPSYAFKFVGIVVGPQKASCGGPGGSFVGSGYDITAQAANVCP